MVQRHPLLMLKFTKLHALAMTALGVLTMAAPLKAEYTAEEKSQIEELKKNYPLTTCPVSGEKLEGPMGGPVDYLYKQKGADGKETTRLVEFCCKDCTKKFTKDPAKYLKVIDEAVAKNASAPATPNTNSGNMNGMDHSAHNHSMHGM